jgi:dTDP-glucose 4,6-dehydratase
MLNPLAHDLDHVLAHTQGVWDELRGAHLFVTGGTGFFGCWLLESFAWACDRLRLDATMTVLTRSPEAFRGKAPHLADHPAIRLWRGDVRSFAFPEGHFTHLIHGATEASAALNREQPLLMLDTIVDGTRQSLDFAVSSGVKRFLLISSGAVYGTQPATTSHLPESYAGGPDTTDPRWAYGEGKRMAELLSAVYSRDYGLECPIARAFAFVGPYLPLDTHFAIGNFIRDCLEERPIEIRGDGTPYRSYLYAADLAIWLWTILVHGKPGRPYNVGSERAVSIAEIATAAAAELGSSAGIQIAQAAPRGIPAERYVPDTSRARCELGLEERISLEQGIRRTAEWHSRKEFPAAPTEEVPTCA